MNDDRNAAPASNRPAAARLARPIALVGGGLVLGAAIAGTLSAQASTPAGTSSGTATYAQGGAPGGPGGGSADAVVSGAEATRVSDAVKAKDGSVTVSRVQKDPDGSYDVFGTSSGAPVMFEVSADLKTVTKGAGHGGPGGRGPGQGAPGQAGAESPASGSA